MSNEKREISYFKIGVFVLVGIGLIILAILIFGSEKIFKPIVYVETYFEESIQGVSKGTPVKYRGLQVGYIEDIAFTSEIYDAANVVNSDEMIYARSIYVQIAITSKLFTRLNKEELEEFLAKEISQGLRVRLVAQGLTGICYLEFDYVNPSAHPLPVLDWQPSNFYIPSVISTLTRLSESAQYIMSELRDVDFKKIFSDFSDVMLSFHKFTDKTDNLLVSFNGLVNRTDNFLNQIDAPSLRVMQNLKIISDDLRVITDRVKLKPSELIFSAYPPPLNPNKL